LTFDLAERASSQFPFYQNLFLCIFQNKKLIKSNYFQYIIATCLFLALVHFILGILYFLGGEIMLFVLATLNLVSVFFILGFAFANRPSQHSELNSWGRDDENQASFLFFEEFLGFVVKFAFLAVFLLFGRVRLFCFLCFLKQKIEFE
jgi:hypothetical protein